MIAVFLASVLAMGKPVESKPSEQYQILPVSRSGESTTATLTVAEPKEGQTGMQNPVVVQFRVDGYPLGTGSPGPRANEIAASPKGQTVHIIVDNHPYFAVNKSSVDPFNEGGNFYDSSSQFKIPYHLKNGAHVVRMFLARSYGEGLKGSNTFKVLTFSVGDKKGTINQDLDGPYLTYNEPSDHLPLKEGKPILLDFYVANCELTPKSYNVLLTIDGKFKRKLSSWQPYYIYGMKEGKHTVALELLGPNGKRVKGPFNKVERTIEVQY